MSADTEMIREADIEAIHRAIFHAPGDIHAAALAALERVEETLDEIRDVVEGWTDPVISSYEERCDEIRLILARAELSSAAGSGEE